MKHALLPLFAMVSTAAAYDVFHPAPVGNLRDLSPDRPDTTESPVTVDAGHWQVETSLYDWSRDAGNDTHTWASTNVKLGLSDCSDLQLLFDSFLRDEAADAEGFGDITLRYKWNVWGNDGGKTAFALFPFVKIPTGTAASNGEWEGGLILPFTIELADGWSLATMAEIDVVDDPAGSHEFEFVHSVSLAHDFTEKFGGYLEYVGTVTERDYQAQVSAGVTYLIHENLAADAGLRCGLNRAAEDIGLFTGFTIRF